MIPLVVFQMNICVEVAEFVLSICSLAPGCSRLVLPCKLLLWAHALHSACQFTVCFWGLLCDDCNDDPQALVESLSSEARKLAFSGGGVGARKRTGVLIKLDWDH